MKTVKFPFKVVHDTITKGKFEISYSNSKAKESTKFIGPEDDTIHGSSDFVLLTHLEDESSILVSCTNNLVTIWSTKEIKNVDNKYII